MRCAPVSLHDTGRSAWGVVVLVPVVLVANGTDFEQQATSQQEMMMSAVLQT